ADNGDNGLYLVIGRLSIRGVDVQVFAVLVTVTQEGVERKFLLLGRVEVFAPVQGYHRAVRAADVNDHHIPAQLIALQDVIVQPERFTGTGRADNDAVLVVQRRIIPEVYLGGSTETVMVDMPFLVRKVHPLFLQIADGLLGRVDEAPVIGPGIAGYVAEEQVAQLGNAR